MNERSETSQRDERDDDQAPLSFGKRMAKLRAAKPSKRAKKKRRKVTR